MEAVRTANPVNILTWIYALKHKQERVGSLSAEEQKVLTIIEMAASSFGAKLLEAIDEDDLLDRLDAIIEDPEFYRVEGIFADWAFECPEAQRQLLEEVLAEEEYPELEHLFGDGLTGMVRETLKSGAQIGKAIARVAEAEPEAIRTAQDERQGAQLTFLTDPRFPVPIARIILAYTRAEACLYAICQIVITNKHPFPLIAWLICERTLTGFRDYLRLLASAPIFEIPEDVVPLADRLDLDQMSEDAGIAERGYEILRFRAGQSGQVVYTPFGEPEPDHD